MPVEQVKFQFLEPPRETQGNLNWIEKMRVKQARLHFNRIVSNYALMIPMKGAKLRLRGIKQKKIHIIALNLDLDLSFRISEA